jgi:non-ribosomal peptide synthetase component F
MAPTAAGGTPFGVFAFAFRLLLDRYTGGEPVAIATPVSTRAHADTDGMIGYFLNPVVIGSAPDETATVLEAVREFTRQVRDDVSRAALPFPAVVEAVGPPRLWAPVGSNRCSWTWARRSSTSRCS